MHLLEVPAIFSGGELDRQHRRRVKVVASAEGAVVVRRGIPGREIQETEIEIDCRRLPDRSAAVLPRVVVLRPRVVTGLARTRNRVEGPDQTAVFCVVRLDAAACAAIATGEADDDHACPERGRGVIHVERRSRDREILLPALSLDRPRDLPRRAIECREPAVEMPDEDLVLADRDALVVPPAADRGDVRIELRFVLPEDLAAVDRQREHVVGARAHVGDAVIDERRREARVLRLGARSAQARPPHPFELRDVGAVDGLERRIALVVKIAAVGRPARGGVRRQLRPGEIVPARPDLRKPGRNEYDGDSTERREKRQTHSPPSPVRSSPHCFTRRIARETRRHSQLYKPASSRWAGTAAGPVS